MVEWHLFLFGVLGAFLRCMRRWFSRPCFGAPSGPCAASTFCGETLASLGSAGVSIIHHPSELPRFVCQTSLNRTPKRQNKNNYHFAPISGQASVEKYSMASILLQTCVVFRNSRLFLWCLIWSTILTLPLIFYSW